MLIDCSLGGGIVGGGGRSKRCTAERAGIVRAQPLADAGGVEVVHAHRQHPEGVTVGQPGQAHRARRLRRPPIRPQVRAHQRTHRAHHLHGHYCRRRRRLLPAWRYYAATVAVDSRWPPSSTTIAAGVGLLLRVVLHRAQPAEMEQLGQQGDGGQAEDDGADHLQVRRDVVRRPVGVGVAVLVRASVGRRHGYAGLGSDDETEILHLLTSYGIRGSQYRSSCFFVYIGKWELAN